MTTNDTTTAQVAYVTRAVFLDGSNNVETFFVEIPSTFGRNFAARRTARSIVSLHNDNPENHVTNVWFVRNTDEGATIYGPGTKPVVLVTAKTEEEHDAQSIAPTKPVPTGSFDTTSGVTSSPLYGPRTTWARQIKALYASVQHVAIDGRRVRAMHQGGKPFTLGFVTAH